MPVGAYMCVHLVTNASVLNSSAMFQQMVYRIHSLGYALPVVEWVFIFIPILFHAIFGVVIIRGGLPNSGQYPYRANIRYTLQRATGMIAFVFIAWHVFHMHGWFHSEWWLEHVAKPLDGAQFHPYNAASSAGAAIQQGIVVQILYAIGILACVFHLANGMWTMGITWGLWITPDAQAWATKLCAGFGVVLGIIGLSALWGMGNVDVPAAEKLENQMYQVNVESGAISPDDHKRAHAKEGHADEPADPAEPSQAKANPAESTSGAGDTTQQPAAATPPAVSGGE